MTNDEIVAAVRDWQANDVHPLTCRRVTSHRPLEPVLEGNVVVLYCVECSYTQRYIPEAVLMIPSEAAARGRHRPVSVWRRSVPERSASPRTRTSETPSASVAG